MDSTCASWSPSQIQDKVIEGRYIFEKLIGSGSFGRILKVRDIQQNDTEQSIVQLVAKVSANEKMLNNEIRALNHVHDFADNNPEYQKFAEHIPKIVNYGELFIEKEQNGRTLLDSYPDSSLNIQEKHSRVQSKQKKFHTIYKGEEKLVYFTMPRYGPTLEHIFRQCNNRFSSQSVFSLGLTLLNTLELIHKSGLVFNDLKPDNILLEYNHHRQDSRSSFSQPDNQRRSKNYFKDVKIHLIDFGLASHWCDGNTGKHHKQKQLSVFEGNLFLSTVDQMKSKTTSRRDDLISLFYLLSYLLNHGSLPGIIKAIEEKQRGSDEELDIQAKFNAILEVKQSTSLYGMCKGSTLILREFARQIQSLQFNSTPNYDKLRAILKASMDEEDSVYQHKQQRGIFQPHESESTIQMSLKSRNRQLREYQRVGININC